MIKGSCPPKNIRAKKLIRIILKISFRLQSFSHLPDLSQILLYSELYSHFCPKLFGLFYSNIFLFFNKIQKIFEKIPRICPEFIIVMSNRFVLASGHNVQIFGPFHNEKINIFKVQLYRYIYAYRISPLINPHLNLNLQF